MYTSCPACACTCGNVVYVFALCPVSEYKALVLVVVGMQQVTKRSGKKAKVASVLLLTDGQANSGPSTRKDILYAMRNHMRFNDLPIIVSFAVCTLCIAVMYIAVREYCMYSSVTITAAANLTILYSLIVQHVACS